MLSIYAFFLETRIERLHGGLFILEKVLGVYVQRMFEINRYSLVEILSKFFGKKLLDIGDPIYDHNLAN